MTEPFTPEEARAPIERHQALRPSVPLYRHMVYGSGLTHPIDFVILVHIHFMCEDGRAFTVQDLIGALRAEGIRNANGKGDGLVGSKAVYESVARLRGAGFLHRSQNNGGSFGEVSYTFHEFPAADPNWTPAGVTESPDILPVPLTGEAVPVGNHIPAGHTASPHKGSADRGSADRRSGNRPVFAGHTASPHRKSGNVSPPHPPEEEEGTSSSVGSSAATPRRGRAARSKSATPEVPAGAVAAAAQFLQSLPGGFAVGLARSESLAPWLVRNAELTGWDLDLSLRLYLTRKESGKPPVTDFGGCLAYRIKNMHMRAVWMQAAQAGTDEPQEAAPGKPTAVEWCGQCDSAEYRWIAPESGPAKRCPDCHPAEVQNRT